jgi:hypothetical protein
MANETLRIHHACLREPGKLLFSAEEYEIYLDLTKSGLQQSNVKRCPLDFKSFYIQCGPPL